MGANRFYQSTGQQYAYSVDRYGAAGNGSADDTAAINAAATAAGNAGGGTVYLPAGTYKTSAAIILPQNVILQGAGGVAGNSGASRFGASIIKPAVGAQFDAVSTALPPTPGNAGYVAYGVGVRDLAIDCSQVTGTTTGLGNGVHFYGVRYGFISGVCVYNSPNWGFLIEGDNPTNYAYNTSLFNCQTSGCAAGARFTNSEQCSLFRCIFEGAGTATAATQPYSGTNAGTAAYMLYCNTGWTDAVSCTFGSLGTTTAEAVFVDNNETCNITGCLFDSTRGPAFHSVSGNHNFSFNRLVSVCTAVSDSAVKLGAGGHIVKGNVWQSGAPHWTYCVAEQGAYVGNTICDNQFLAGTSGTFNPNAGSTKLTVHHNDGYNPVGKLAAQPAIAASGTAVTNNSGVDCTVYLTGGTFTGSHQIGGQSIGNSTATVLRIAAGQSVTLTYSAAPTWVWFGD